MRPLLYREVIKKARRLGFLLRSITKQMGIPLEELLQA